MFFHCGVKKPDRNDPVLKFTLVVVCKFFILLLLSQFLRPVNSF